MTHDVPFISRQVVQGDYYFLNLSPLKQSKLEVVCGGREVCDSSYVIDRQSFEYASIELVTSGLAHVALAGGKALELRAGWLFRYGPGVSQRISVPHGQRVVKYFVDFVGTRASELLKRHWPALQPLRVSDVARAQAVFEELAYVARRPSPNTAARAALLLEQLILMLADEAADERQDAEAGWQLYQKCRGRIAERYRELSSLHELAKSCHVSEAYICRLFRRYDNVSPYRLIQRLRMAEAASLLLDLRLLVKQVAARVGYDDAFQFSKAFKREYGVSPRAFRSHPRAAFELAPPARR